MQDARRTARTTGVLYLALAITGGLSFLVFRPGTYTGDTAETLTNLVEHETFARLGLGMEMALVVSGALAAVWFYKLFREINPVAAFATATFGLVNVITQVASSMFLATSLVVAGNHTLAPAGDAAAVVGLMGELSAAAWSIGGLFFGLWLIPMGWVAISNGRFPRLLGWILVVGGFGYVLSAFIGQMVVGAPAIFVEGLAFPATVGEVWMVGYLLTAGIRPAPAE
jgi:hypothetical protein